MPPRTASISRPLTEDERKTFQELLARDSANKGPAVRIGKPYVALTNLSVPRRGDPDRNVDLVRPGEVVHLTDEEAATYMRHGPRDGRQLSVIAPAGSDEAKQLAGKVPPRAFSGKLTAPPADARPDPAGSSAIQNLQPAAPVPEASEPQPGSEATAGQAGADQIDAADIIPDRVRARAQQGR